MVELPAEQVKGGEKRVKELPIMNRRFDLR
jgi:hypothetical protein